MTAPLEPDHFDTRLGAYVVIVDEQQRILLALWNEVDPPVWTLIGGGAELDETVEQTAIREAREESGFDVELIELLGVDTWTVPAEDRHTPAIGGERRPLKNVRVIFSGRIVGGRLTAEIGGSTDEAMWIPLAQLADLPRVGLVDTAVRMWRSRLQ